MSKRVVKTAIWAAITAIALAAAYVLFTGISALLAFFHQGANPASALNIVPNVPPDLHVKLTWLPDDADTGRAMEPYARTAIESSYLRAWLQWNISYLKDQPYGLKTYFDGPALSAVDDSVLDAAKRGLHVSQADTEHVLKLHFYSADGSIISFTDSDAVVAQSIKEIKGTEIYAGETTAVYDVVMFLNDGNWTVRQWLRTSGTTPTDTLPPPSTSDSFVRVSGTSLTLNGQPYNIAGINYYPQNTPWDKFWARYDGAVTDSDFAKVQSLGLNSIRIFVPFEQFGGAKVDPLMVAKLDDLLQRATAHNLKVLVTLFDFRTDYSLLAWPADDRHLEALLTHFSANTTILGWDLKNEPDRDYAQGQKSVQSWLAHTARLARFYDPNHLITIGWSTPQAALTLPDMVDFITFHYYAPAAQLADAYTNISKIAPNKPIDLTEFGLPTWNIAFFPNGHTEPEQTEYYADILSTLRAEGSGYIAWTLYDFPSVPGSVAGSLPWQSGPQKNMGVIKSDGKPKGAAALLSLAASLNVTKVPSCARFLKPFWLTLFLLALLAGVILRKWWLKRFSHRYGRSTPGEKEVE